MERAVICIVKSNSQAETIVGAFTGALVGMGIPEFEAKQYEGKLREGNILISVHTEDGDQRKLAKEIFENAGAEHVRSAGEEKVQGRA